MTTTTQTIADFLLARVSEDEAAARAATWGDGHGHSPLSYARSVDATHIARHDPARVLADCEAKRAIIGLHDDGKGWDRECEHDVRDGGCPTLQAFAFVYADHPGFDPSWR